MYHGESTCWNACWPTSAPLRHRIDNVLSQEVTASVGGMNAKEHGADRGCPLQLRLLRLPHGLLCTSYLFVYCLCLDCAPEAFCNRPKNGVVLML
jgi:hypothetical protein